MATPQLKLFSPVEIALSSVAESFARTHGLECKKFFQGKDLLMLRREECGIYYGDGTPGHFFALVKCFIRAGANDAFVCFVPATDEGAIQVVSVAQLNIDAEKGRHESMKQSLRQALNRAWQTEEDRLKRKRIR